MTVAIQESFWVEKAETTDSGLSGVPLWNFTLERRRITHRRLVLSDSQDTASEGFILPYSSRLTSRSKTREQIRSRAAASTGSAGGSRGSRERTSARISSRKAPPKRGRRADSAEVTTRSRLTAANNGYLEGRIASCLNVARDCIRRIPACRGPERSYKAGEFQRRADSPRVPVHKLERLNYLRFQGVAAQGGQHLTASPAAALDSGDFASPSAKAPDGGKRFIKQKGAAVDCCQYPKNTSLSVRPCGREERGEILRGEKILSLR